MSGYITMLNSVVEWLFNIYDLRPKDLEYQGYDFNCYKWSVKEDILWIDGFKGTVIVDNHRTIFDLNNLQLNIIYMDDNEEITIKNGEIVTEVIAGILSTEGE